MELTWLCVMIPVMIGLGFLMVLLYFCFLLSGQISRQQEELILHGISPEKTSKPPTQSRKRHKPFERSARREIHGYQFESQIGKWNRRYPDWRDNGRSNN